LYNDSDIVNGYHIIPSVMKFDYNLLQPWPFDSPSNDLLLTLDIKSVDYNCSLFPLPSGTEVIINIGLVNYAKVFFPNTVLVDGVSKNIISLNMNNQTGLCRILLRLPSYTTTLKYDPIAALPTLFKYNFDPYFQADYPNSIPTSNGGTSNGGTSTGGSNGGTNSGGTNGGTSNGGTNSGDTNNGGTSNGGTNNGGTTGYNGNVTGTINNNGHSLVILCVLLLFVLIV